MNESPAPDAASGAESGDVGVANSPPPAPLVRALYVHDAGQAGPECRVPLQPTGRLWRNQQQQARLREMRERYKQKPDSAGFVP